MEWFNGKKTIVATVLFMTAAFVEEIVVGQFGAVYAMPAWVALVGAAVKWIAVALGATGLGHKYMKRREQ